MSCYIQKQSIFLSTKGVSLNALGQSKQALFTNLRRKQDFRAGPPDSTASTEHRHESIVSQANRTHRGRPKNNADSRQTLGMSALHFITGDYRFPPRPLTWHVENPSPRTPPGYGTGQDTFHVPLSPPNHRHFESTNKSQAVVGPVKRAKLHRNDRRGVERSGRGGVRRMEHTP